MHSSNDNSTIDSLANFESAIRTSRDELQRDEQRYEALKKSVKAAEVRVRSAQREVTDATDRCEILENECGRIAHANNQRREQINFIRTQMDSIVAPRNAIEAQTSTIKVSVSKTRRELCKGALRATTDVLTSLREHNPEELQKKVASKKAEHAATMSRVEKYRSDLAILQQAAKARAAAEAEAKRKEKERALREQTQSAKNSHAVSIADDLSDNVKDELSATESLRARLLEALLENRFTLTKEIERMTAQLNAKRAENAAKTEELTAARDEAKARIRAFGHSMPMAEQLANNAENAYHEVLDQSHGVTCSQCGSAELGFEMMVSS